MPLTQLRRKSGPVPRTPGLVPRGPAPAPETAPSPSNPRLVPRKCPVLQNPTEPDRISSPIFTSVTPAVKYVEASLGLGGVLENGALPGHCTGQSRGSVPRRGRTLPRTSAPRGRTSAPAPDFCPAGPDFAPKGPDFAPRGAFSGQSRGYGPPTPGYGARARTSASTCCRRRVSAAPGSDGAPRRAAMSRVMYPRQ